MSIVETVLVFVGIPALIIAVLALLVFAPMGLLPSFPTISGGTISRDE